jgi:ferritin-like metal-binding protein YciE
VKKENYSQGKKIGEKRVADTFNKVMSDLYLAERSIEKASSCLLEIENIYGPQGLREMLEKIGNKGKASIVDELRKIINRSDELKTIIATHKTVKKRGRRQDG